MKKVIKDKIIVNFKNVTKKFGDDVVLNNINFSVYKEEVLIICGISGSGKSTLLRCINHLEPINSGTVTVDGVGVEKNTKREICKKVGMVFQMFNLFPHLNAVENVILAPQKVLGWPKEKAYAKAKKLFDIVGLSNKMNSYPRDLSGGQKQRVAIARALCMDPELILFDEPTSALDPEMIKGVLDIMKDLAKKGMTMIVVTHEMGFAKEVSDRVAFLHNGQFLEIAPTKEFFEKQKHEKIKQFLDNIL